jgi:hypothetical protein
MKIRTGLVTSAFFLLLGIALLAPTSKTYGQLIAQENLLSMRNYEVVHYTADLKSEISGTEFWMLVPFVNNLVEEEFYLESWMIAPFESVVIDQELTVESWMTVLFGVDQDTEIEDWMASAWF